MRRSPLGSAMLAIAAAAALALGASWWVGNAPPATSAQPPFPLLPPTAVVTASPVRYPEPTLTRWGFDVDLARVERLLPERIEKVRGLASVLTDGETIDYSGTVGANTQYLLEVACLGAGALEIEVVTPDHSRHTNELNCDGTLGSVEFAIRDTGYAVILLVADTNRFVEVAVQLMLR